MTRLLWTLAQIPVSLLAVGVGRSKSMLPKPPKERSRPEPKWAPASLGLGMLGWAARTGARRFHDRDGRWREFGNKVAAFRNFRSAGASAAVGAGDQLAEDAFADLWRREGIGYLLGLASVSNGKEDVARAQRSPRRDLITRHTGMGLGLGVYHLQSLGSRSTTVEVGCAIGRFLDDCHRLSCPGYAEATIEALGLTVKLLQPDLLAAVEEALRQDGSAFRSLFWHGVGRGIYFDPADLAPRRDGRWRALEWALAVPGDREGRSNAVSGLTWALTLVNLRHPEIVARRLRHEKLAGSGDAVANGVASATVLWRDSVGDDAVLRGFLGYRPEAGTAAGKGWRRRVADPIELAQRDVYPLLREEGRLGELFRYRPLSGWVESLGGSATGRPMRSAGAGSNPEVPSRG